MPSELSEDTLQLPDHSQARASVLVCPCVSSCVLKRSFYSAVNVVNISNVTDVIGYVRRSTFSMTNLNTAYGKM